ncbi:MAG: saccharopine dehydrogenase NADP-binding domain-containing protein [Promethearchaeota archaeon]|nr:MAG: saccharopine dehydrogenase NADP-binding domain-containing protein [Candidatus Lokiarchaeota archaeon]
MKILALGGAGDMGRMAVAILLESPQISSITIADKNYDRAQHFVELVGSDRLSAYEIDVTEHDNLVELVSSHDLVMNTTGPFYRFATMILNAVIEAKKPYIDICDDWKPTLDLLDMNKKTKKAEITAIIGMGASPGLTNLMAVIACSELDETDELITAWGMGLMKEGDKPQYYILPRKFYKKYKNKPLIANAATMHLFYETLENIPTFKDRKIVNILPLTEAEPLQFPGFKDTYVCHIGHPEPVTLPRVIKANSVSNVMFIGKTATDIIREYTQKILDKELSISEASIEFFKESSRLERDPEIVKEYMNIPPGLCVIASGMKDGKRKKVALAIQNAPFGAMAGVTGVPLAIAALMLINGEIKGKGVFTPEEVISDPIEFFNRLAPYCGKNLTGKDILLKKLVDL